MLFYSGRNLMTNEDFFNYSDIEDLINNFPFDSNQENEM